MDGRDKMVATLEGMADRPARIALRDRKLEQLGRQLAELERAGAPPAEVTASREEIAALHQECEEDLKLTIGEYAQVLEHCAKHLEGEAQLMRMIGKVGDMSDRERLNVMARMIERFAAFI